MLRMNILNTVERDAFDLPPVFNIVECKDHFRFSQPRKGSPARAPSTAEMSVLDPDVIEFVHPGSAEEQRPY